VAKRHFVRREACPKCNKGVVAVTYERVIDAGGNVTREAPIRAAGCRTDGCQSEWFDSRAKREDANPDPARPSRRAWDVSAAGSSG